MTPDQDRTAQRHDAGGRRGGHWRDDDTTVWYSLRRGLIAEQDVGDSGRDERTP